jgi:hypothetical protein
MGMLVIKSILFSFFIFFAALDVSAQFPTLGRGEGGQHGGGIYHQMTPEEEIGMAQGTIWVSLVVSNESIVRAQRGYDKVAIRYRGMNLSGREYASVLLNEFKAQLEAVKSDISSYQNLLSQLGRKSDDPSFVFALVSSLVADTKTLAVNIKSTTRTDRQNKDSLAILKLRLEVIRAVVFPGIGIRKTTPFPPVK